MTEREIFSEALLRTDPDDLAAYLNEACGRGTALRNRVEELLAGYARSHPVLDHQPVQLFEALAPSTPSEEGDSPEAQLAHLLGPSPRPGALGRLAQYDILAVLGQGGFGIVVKAFDDSLQRVVAIKLLSLPLAATSPPRKRFLREARAVAQLKHEHVVQLYGVEEQPVPYLVMEFVDGPTLQEKLDREGPLDPPEVIRLGCQIARGLAAAHDKGIIHRDVKPANVLLEAGPVESRAKLTDFGLARTMDDASQTQSGVFAGSPLYMAPEQVRGETLDARADLFSLGSILYTMTAGRPAFRASNTFLVFKRVAEDTPRPLGEVIRDTPPGLVAVINKLLAKRPEERFNTAHEVVDALSDCLTVAAPHPPAARGTRRWAAVSAAALLLAFAIGWAVNQAGLFQRDREAVAAASSSASNAKAAAPVSPRSLVVTSALDDGSTGTLRWAITEANERRGENVITFDAESFSKPTTIKLARGPLILSDSSLTTISGPAAGVTVSGDEKHQVFVVGDIASGSSARAWISDLTIADGQSTEELNLGGGVLCRGGSFLTLSGCTLQDNTAMLHGGGGGGLFIGESTAILYNCTFRRNMACEGGAIKNFAGVLKATNCTLVGNTGEGVSGGIYTLGWNRAQTEVNNCIFDNTAFGGFDLYLFDGRELIGDYNISRDGSAPGIHSKINTSAQLGPLGRNGGPTETFPLLADSPAIDAGNNDFVPAQQKVDQRGSPRIRESKVDIGAYESQ